MSDDPSRTSIGEYLATQRKLRGISVDELCELTKIPRRNIERLESGALDGTHDGFMRGFVRAIADALGLDADEAVMRLLDEPTADERPARQGVPVAALWGGVLLVVVLLLGLAIQGLRGWWGAREAEAEATEVLRRPDAVGELLRDQAPAPAPGTPPDGP